MNAELVADFVVDNGLAVVWSQRIDGDDPGAGKKGRSGWQLAKPWPKGNRDGLVAQLNAYHRKRNLLIVTKPSGLLTIDVDTEVGREKYESLGAPDTSFVVSGREGGGYHFIFRPPAEGLPYSFFEIAGDENARVTGAASTKLHVVAGFHKTGREYELCDAGIATLPRDVYDRLERGYGYNGVQQRAELKVGKLIHASGRHDYLLQQADYFRALGYTGEILRAHLRVDYDLACVHDDSFGPVDHEIDRIATWTERRYVS